MNETKNKKYDIFTFNAEFEMLDIRLHTLNDYVDYFVIIESTETFTGVPKPLYYDKFKERYKKYHHKIIHHAITDTPSYYDDKNCDQVILKLACESDGVTRDRIQWLKEFYQKESIKKAILTLNDDDICYVSDVDEIWNYNDDFEIKDSLIYKYLIELCYMEYLNLRTDENWTFFTGPIVTKYKNIKNETLNYLRTFKKMQEIYQYRYNGGWHFNSLGGIDKKVNDFKQYYHPSELYSRKTGTFIEEEKLPKAIFENKHKLKHLFV